MKAPLEIGAEIHLRRADGCASYFPEFHEMGLKMIKAQGGIFGWVSDSASVLHAMSKQNVLETSQI